MAGRYLKWPMLVASAGATVALMVATARFTPGGPIRVRPMALHRAGTPNVGFRLVKAAEDALEQDRYDDAERFCREALAVQEKALGPEHILLAQTLSILSSSFLERNHFHEAEPLLRRALTIAERCPSSCPSGRIFLLGRLAFVPAPDGDRAKCDVLSRRSIGLALEYPGDLGRNLVDALNMRGAFLARIEGRLAEAALLFEWASAIIEEDPEADPEDLAHALTNLGECHSRLGHYPEAERLLLRSRSILDRESGLPGLRQLDALQALGALYWRQGRYDEAEPYQRQVMAIAEASLGPDHPSMVQILLELAEILAGRNEFAEVEPLARRALALAEKVFAAESAELGNALTKSARILRDRGFSDEAVPLLNRALAIAEKVDGLNSLSVAVILEVLAKTHDVRGMPADVEAATSRAIAIREKVGLEKDDVLANNLLCLSWHLVTQKKYAEAEPLARKAFSMNEQAEEPSDTNRVFCLYVMAGVASGLGHHAEAETLLKRELEILEKTPVVDFSHLLCCLLELSKSLAAQGRDAESQATLERYSEYLKTPAAIAAGAASNGESQPEVKPTAGDNLKPYFNREGERFARLPAEIGIKMPEAIGNEGAFPQHHFDLNVEKTSGTNPNSVFPPTPPQ